MNDQDDPLPVIWPSILELPLNLQLPKFLNMMVGWQISHNLLICVHLGDRASASLDSTICEALNCMGRSQENVLYQIYKWRCLFFINSLTQTFSLISGNVRSSRPRFTGSNLDEAHEIFQNIELPGKSLSGRTLNYDPRYYYSTVKKLKSK